MTTPLSISATRLADGTPVLAAAGEIDTNNCAQLDSAIRAALRQEAKDGRALVVDLSAVGYLDSAGLGVLFDYVERVEVVANSLLAPVLTMTGLTGVMKVRGLDSPPAAAAEPGRR